jgi:two-component system cell cycle response regulator
VRLASFDPLTGLHNRRVFFERAEDASRRCPMVTAIMLDIDHFKRINDVFGHDVGDQAITAVAQAIATEGAVTGRLGGEEFALLLEARTIEEGVVIAERLRTRVAALRFETAHGIMTLSCSFGVSERKQNESIDDLLKRADVALYAAKTGGRNRVVAAGAMATTAFGRSNTVIHALTG